MRGGSVIFESPVFAAFVAGLYVSIFYIISNITLLPASSAFIVALVLIAPLMIAVALLCLLLRMLGKSAYAKPVSIFICVIYILTLMQRPIFEIHFIGEFFDQRHGIASDAVKVLYLIIPAVMLGYIFRDSIGKFAVVLGAMTFASIVSNIDVLADGFIGKDHLIGSEMAKSLQGATLSQSPNIYFIMADGYGSLAYMKENGIDVEDFKSFLSGDGFKLYEEAFGNYHSTAEALPAILNMDHHYYSLNHNRESSEVRKSGRIIVGGKNNLVDLLRRNSYEVQYIHNWPYLLLHGCSADHCYGAMPLAGAKMVLGGILPFAEAQRVIDEIWSRFTIEAATDQADYWVSRSQQLKHYGERRSLEDSRREVVRLIEQNAHKHPTFQYIHMYAPIHSPNSQIGVCDESYQISYYSERVTEVNRHLQDLVSDIVSRDSSAVIVLMGDHGPFIANKCSRWTDLDTLSGYRDRMGVLMAIRWPETYDGRYDERIVTTINVFKYVLAALAKDDTAILETVACDDVYILGSTDILKIVADGSPLIPPQHYTSEALQLTRHESCQANDY